MYISIGRRRTVHSSQRFISRLHYNLIAILIVESVGGGTSLKNMTRNGIIDINILYQLSNEVLLYDTIWTMFRVDVR